MTALSSEHYLLTAKHSGPMTPDLADKIMAMMDATTDATRAAAKAGNDDLRAVFSALWSDLERIPTCSNR